MDERDGRYTIGDLARRTGLTVKAIRFYGDRGIVPPTGRTAAGYRVYDAAAAARLDLVRTLRDLGLDLATIRAVLDREADLGEVAAAHADALDAQIRVLRLRRAVLRTVAHRTPDDREITLMNRLARLSAEERQRIIDDYHDAVFGGLELDPRFEAGMRSVRVDLPDDPTDAQVDAWVELAELVRDPAFVARVREMAEAQARAVADGTYEGATPEAAGLAERITAVARPLFEAGVDPASERARAAVDGLMGDVAAAYGTGDTPGDRAALADRFAVGSDARVERYWQLVGVVNGRPPFEPQVPVWDWFIAALRASARG
ncbi:MerR family transcriptional regulator [Nocardiopsis trehalosi]|jgi:DNA-binding transcriptional MerR regulator|uniref:MerR family transcriptional regulator n=1 Tax=Nocardiopsis trehalosi TaxID=109329 RepID=UPI0008365946|nr:MerR family transcriptional regulator [Nocardiopsis trehalosi]